jgi:hypothetical protein
MATVSIAYKKWQAMTRYCFGFALKNGGKTIPVTFRENISGDTSK